MTLYLRPPLAISINLGERALNPHIGILFGWPRPEGGYRHCLIVCLPRLHAWVWYPMKYRMMRAQVKKLLGFRRWRVGQISITTSPLVDSLVAVRRFPKRAAGA